MYQSGRIVAIFYQLLKDRKKPKLKSLEEEEEVMEI